MPLEIRELVIKASVGGESTATNDPSNKMGAETDNNDEARTNLIVEKVLEILSEKTER